MIAAGGGKKDKEKRGRKDRSVRLGVPENKDKKDTGIKGYGCNGIPKKTEKKEVYAGRSEWCGSKRDQWKR